MNPISGKSRFFHASLLAVVSAATLAAAVAATPPPPPPGDQPPARDDMHGPGGMRGEGMGGKGMRGEGMGGKGMRGGPMEMMDPFMRALHKLDLSTEQRDKVHGIMEAAHKSHEGQMRAIGENLTVIGNPGDPGYGAAVQAAKDNTAAMIQHHSDLDKQIYALLTPEQKAKLPQLLGEMKARLDERKQHWEQREHDRAAEPGMPKH